MCALFFNNYNNVYDENKRIKNKKPIYGGRI
jgi:hypothetical protein